VRIVFTFFGCWRILPLFFYSEIISMGRIKEWISGRVFQMVHGRHLVYNTCWEDPRIDKEVLNLSANDNLLVITSAGCNALSYALSGLNHIYAVDMNYRQNALLDLKIAAIKQLDYETFFTMFGHGHTANPRELYRDKLRDLLPEKSRHFWDLKIKKYFGHRRRTLYFHGTTGVVARGINAYIDKIAKIRKPINELLDAKSLEEQRDIWFNKIKPRLWGRTIRAIMNRNTTMSMLGVPEAQLNQINKQYPGGLVKFIEDCLDSVFGTLPINDNYFWRVYSTGSYLPTCCPEYLERENFEKLKGGLVNRITTHTMTVEQFLRTVDTDVRISRFVLLDHMDWLSHHLYGALVAEWDAILDRAAHETRILWRSGGLRTEYIDTIPVERNGDKCELGSLLQMHTEQAAELHKKDRVHTYGSFYIADLKR
jgi:S-adenosylmethionine-diacylglycerol 3-amino-3-carboxypropyl transferase